MPRLTCGARLYIYFVQCTRTARIKIGRTDDIVSRAMGLQGSSPVELRLVGLLVGPALLEPSLHAHFADHRLHGEWFDAAQPVVEFVGQVKDGTIQNRINRAEFAIYDDPCRFIITGEGADLTAAYPDAIALMRRVMDPNPKVPLTGGERHRLMTAPVGRLRQGWLDTNTAKLIGVPGGLAL